MVRTLNDAYLDLRNEMRRLGIAGYHIEARELVCKALSISRADFSRKNGILVFEKDEQAIRELLARRLSGEPVQHITGEWEFYSLDLYVSPDVLIPRADSETLVECGVDFLKNRDKGRILDLCCGSGCIGIAALKNLAHGITGVFGDISEKALRITRKNILRHELTTRALTIALDAQIPCGDNIGKFNLILSNPPYIPSDEIETLDKEVQNEPRLALDGGEDGLCFYRDICENYRPALARGGALMFEVGLGQAFYVSAIMEQNGYKSVQTKYDLTGAERVVWGILE